MGANFFVPLPPIPAGASGPQVPVDLAAAVPPTGLDDHLTFVCVGDIVNGYIGIEGSPDGVNYDVLTQFSAGNDADGLPGPALEFSPVTVDATVRFIRANVQCTVRDLTEVTVGGQQNCLCILGQGPGTNCPDITLDEDGERSSNGGQEELIAEWFVDFGPIIVVGATMGVFFSGIMKTLLGDEGSIARLYIGASAPGTIDGLLVSSFTTDSLTDDPVAAVPNNAPNPGGPVLVQVTLQTPGESQDVVFLRGFVAQFTCPVIFIE